MKRKLKQLIVINSTNINKTSNHLSSQKKRPQHMTLEIQVLASDRHRRSWHVITPFHFFNFLLTLFIFNKISLPFHLFFFNLTCSCPYSCNPMLNSKLMIAKKNSSDVSISERAASKMIHLMSDRCIHKNRKEPTRRGNYFVFKHAYFQLCSFYPFTIYYIV